jgi:hypothetical protein
LEKAFENSFSKIKSLPLRAMTIGKFYPGILCSLAHEKSTENIAKPGCRPLLNFVKTLSFKRKVCGREAEMSVFELMSASLPNLIFFQLIAAP